MRPADQGGEWRTNAKIGRVSVLDLCYEVVSLMLRRSRTLMSIIGDDSRVGLLMFDEPRFV